MKLLNEIKYSIVVISIIGLVGETASAQDSRTFNDLISIFNTAYYYRMFEPALEVLNKAINTNTPASKDPAINVRLGDTYLQLNRIDDAIMTYSRNIINLTPECLLKLLSLYAEKKNDLTKAEEILQLLKRKNIHCVEISLGQAKILRTGGDLNKADSILADGIRSFPDSYDLYFERAKLSLQKGDTSTAHKMMIPLFAAKILNHEQSMQIAEFIEQKNGIREAAQFIEGVKGSRYWILLKLAGYYKQLKMQRDYARIMNLIIIADSTTSEVVEKMNSYGDTTLEYNVYAQIKDLMISHADYLKSAGEDFEKTKNYVETVSYYQRYISQPIVQKYSGDNTLAKMKEKIKLLENESKLQSAIQLYSRGHHEDAKKIAWDLCYGLYYWKISKDPLDIDALLRRGICFYLIDDVPQAEGELRKHTTYATEQEKQIAVQMLNELVTANVFKPDVLDAIHKYYGGIQNDIAKSELKDNTSKNEMQGDISKRETSAVPVKKPVLVNLMALESFSESHKINPEADKSYLLVHSQVGNLRFDSNRKIIKVNQISSGDWELWIPVGTHILKFDADGFQRLELPPMNFGKKRSYEINIKMAPPETE